MGCETVRTRVPAVTPKQERFVVEYLVDLNATQAAIRAGYSKKTAQQQGSRLLSNVVIQDRVAVLRGEVSESTKLTVEGVLERLDEVARRCLQAEPVLDRKGDPVYVQTPNGEEVPAYTFQAAGANRALELLGKHLGAWVERHEHSGSDGGPIVSKIEREIVDVRRLSKETLRRILSELKESEATEELTEQIEREIVYSIGVQPER